MVKHRRTTRKHRMRGGGTASCELSGASGSGQTSDGAPKTITVLEDEMRVASPQQMLCFGDTFTSCQTLIIVLQDNWKVGVHLNSTMFVAYDNATTYNPITLLPLLKTLFLTHPQFQDKPIRYIYLVSSMDSSVLHRRNAASFFETINNSSSMFRLGANANTRFLSSGGTSRDMMRQLFTQVFGDQITDETQILAINNKEVKVTTPLAESIPFPNGFPVEKRRQHFFVYQDGTLEIVYSGGAYIYPAPA